MKLIILTLLFSVINSTALALTFDLTQQAGDVVGEKVELVLSEPLTLEEIGRKNELGPREMEIANPDLPKTGALPVGTKVVVPTQFILPKERIGIVINVAEYRLYFFPEGKNTVETFPVAIAAVGREIPQGETRVVRKLVNPTWTPTPNQRKAKPGLPQSIGPGPNNPLGPRALLLGIPDILIHGTNKPESIGTRASFGCFRMLKEHIGSFWGRVPEGMKVALVNRPISFGRVNDEIYVKMLPSLEGDNADSQFEEAVAEFKESITDVELLKNAKRDGSVVKVGRVNRSPLREADLLPEPVSISQKDQVLQSDKEAQRE